MQRRKGWICRRYLTPYRPGQLEVNSWTHSDQKILAGDYAPGFFMKHFIKDMKLALTEANMSNISLDVLSQVLANYEMLQAEGYGDLGTQALIKYYEEEMEE